MSTILLFLPTRQQIIKDSRTPPPPTPTTRVRAVFAAAEVVALPYLRLPAPVPAPAQEGRLQVLILGATVLGKPGRPARISLSNVEAVPQDGDSYSYGSFDDGDNYDEDAGDAEGLEEGGAGLEEEEEEGGAPPVVVDVALFRVPSRCAYAMAMADGKEDDDDVVDDMCRWEERGVGASVAPSNGTAAAASASASFFWCCHSRAVEAGACEDASPYRNRLIYADSFAGFRRAINATSEQWGPIKYRGFFGDSDFLLPDPGAWVVLFANCGEEGERGGQDVFLSGDVEFESDHGYLPSEFGPSMRRAVALAALYSCLMSWFACQMCDHAGSSAPVETWILLAVALGSMEAWLRTKYYLRWNAVGVPDSQAPSQLPYWVP